MRGHVAGTMVLPISRPETNQAIRDQVTWRDRRPAFASAGLALVVVTVLVYLFNSVSPYARPEVLKGLNNSVFWLATALIGACGTIAALMLTTVSLMEHLETRRMSARFLFNLRLTVLAALGTIGVAILTLLLTIFPSAGTDKFSPRQWQVDVIYYASLALTALMVGGFAIVLTSLYATIADVFNTLPREWVEDILAEEEAAGAEERPERAASRP